MNRWKYLPQLSGCAELFRLISEFFESPVELSPIISSHEVTESVVVVEAVYSNSAVKQTFSSIAMNRAS